MNGLLGSMGRFRAACRAARLYQRTGMRGLLRRSGLLRLLRLDGAEALLPDMPGRFIVPHGQVWRPPQGRAVVRRVALFTGCIMSTAFAATTEATARVLARRGCEVVAVAGQGCCGAFQLDSGAAGEARALARRNVEAFSSEPFDAVVVNAAGCGSTLKGYEHLLESDGAAGFAGRVRDITEYLAELPADVAAGELRCAVTYQEPCHLAHAQRITQQPRRLLRAIPGLELREMRESALCCGSAGIYNLTNGEMAARLLERKLDNAEETGASVIATANPGCLLQLQAGARERGSSVQVRHIVDLIDAAERLAER
jgi:glycolate oxidase iron-sulfur subunit